MTGIYAPIRYYRGYQFTCPNCGTKAHGRYRIAEVPKGQSAPPLDHGRMVCSDERGRPAGQPRAERFNPVFDAEFSPRLWTVDHGCGMTLAEAEAKTEFAREAEEAVSA